VVCRADTAICNACPLKAACTESSQGRQVQRSFTSSTSTACAPTTRRLPTRRRWPSGRSGRAAVRRSEELARAAAIPTPRALEGQQRGADGRDWPEPETAPQKAGLGAPPVAEWGSGGAFCALESVKITPVVPFIHLRVATRRFAITPPGRIHSQEGFFQHPRPLHDPP
jgi:hypothetical protein